MYEVSSARQSYWSIAEETLGDPLRWTEIRDLNVGRVMADGAVLSADAEDLQPGWRLALPDGAALPEEAYEETRVVVEPGDNQWKLAEERLQEALGRAVSDAEVAPYWRATVDANRDNIRSGDPDLIQPGETLDLPAPAESLPGLSGLPAVEGETTGLSPPAVWVEDAPAAVDTRMWVTEETAEPPDVASLGDSQGGSAAAAAAAVAGGAAAAGWWWRFRRRVARGAAGDPTAPPSPAPAEAIDDRGVWAAADALASFRGAPPALDAVIVSAQLTRVIAPGCRRAPSGWVASDTIKDGWEISTRSVTAELPNVASAALPGLVRIGVSSEAETLWINLEAAPIVAIDGVAPHVTPVLALLAERLTNRPGVTVVWVGGDPPAGCVAMTAAEAADHLSGLPAEAGSALASRLEGDRRPLTVVLAAAAAEHERRALTGAARDLGRDRGGAAVISWASQDVESTYSWTMTAPGALAVAAMASHIAIDGLDAPAAAAEVEGRPLPAVELQLLGRPRLIVDGGEARLQRRHSLEFLAYLVTNPVGAGTAKLIDVLWPSDPDQLDKKQALQLCAWEVRKHIGIERLPRAHDSWYRAEVTSDEQRFTDHVASAESAESAEERAGHLRQALDLVRGAPFEGADWLWAATEGLMTSSMQRVHEAAHRLADLDLAAGRYADADAAVARGLAADAYCDRCWDLRLTAASASGDEAHRRRLEQQRRLAHVE